MITIYTQPTCGQCRTVKMLLDQKGIKYNLIEDIEQMKQKGVVHTPTVLTPSGEMLVGSKIIEWIRSYHG